MLPYCMNFHVLELGALTTLFYLKLLLELLTRLPMIMISALKKFKWINKIKNQSFKIVKLKLIIFYILKEKYLKNEINFASWIVPIPLTNSVSVTFNATAILTILEALNFATMVKMAILGASKLIFFICNLSGWNNAKIFNNFTEKLFHEVLFKIFMNKTREIFEFT